MILSYSTKPDLTFFLDISLVAALERKIQKSILINNSQTAKRIEKKYKELAEKENWVRIDAESSKDVIYNKCFSVVIQELDKMVEYEKTPYCLTSMI